MIRYAEVILPLALPGTYTYRVPEQWATEISPGKRVVVQFGKRKLYTAVVHSLHQHFSADFEPKDLLQVMDDQAVVTDWQLDFWQWLADYYLCTLGEVMTAALPAGLKLESEMTVLRNRAKALVDDELNDTQFLIIEALEQEDQLSIKEIAAIIDLNNPLPIVKELLGMQYLFLKEELKGGYRPLRKRLVQRTEKSEEEWSAIFKSLEKAPKQSQLLLALFQLRPAGGPISAVRLLKESQSNNSALKALEQKGILNLNYGQEESHEEAQEKNALHVLNQHQEKALAEIKTCWKEQETVLLHGVTSSGKTEVYKKLIDAQLAQGKSVLYLVPEIALTTQLIQRLTHNFGEHCLVYHSRFSDRERVETWLSLRNSDQKSRVVVGARSALFLPFEKLGLIVIDEEHESSFKQYEPAPRYNARDAALMLAHQLGAKVLMGSATPSLESFFNAQTGKYGLVELSQRYGNMALPEILCVDMKEARRKKKLHGHFSEFLHQAMKETLQAGKQIILFQNRRGFSTVVQCQTCGHVVQCKHCDISMTYHKYSNSLRCHYCGYQRQVPKRCPACQSHEVRTYGFGTEKLEDDLQLMFPEKNIQRMDLDTTRRKDAFERIIQGLEDGVTDILVGTQMVTKGLDFENVGLVGIMNADALLNFPDFRAHERAFQLLAQVAGRAGRKGSRGKVIIQSAEPYHHVIRKVIDNDYQAFYQEEVYERKHYQYPPHHRLIKIVLKHRDKQHLEQRTRLYAQRLRDHFGDRLLGPEFPLVARLRNRYQMELQLKLEPQAARQKVKALIRNSTEEFEKDYPKGRIQIIFDVDPY